MTTDTEWTGPAALHRAAQNVDLDALHGEAHAELKSGRQASRAAAVDRLNILEGLKRAGHTPADWFLTKAPIVPPKFRPYVVSGDTYLAGDVNELYREFDQVNGAAPAIESALGKAALTKHLGTRVYPALAALTGHGEPLSPELKTRQVTGFLHKVTGSNPKQSWYQQHLLGRNQDYVGRGVITVDPDLGLDEVGVPEDILWPTFAPHIQRRLVRQGHSPSSALEHVTDRTPTASRALDQEILERPVMYSRAPAWWKFSALGGWARRRPPEERAPAGPGPKDSPDVSPDPAPDASPELPKLAATLPTPSTQKSISINPLVTTGYNADFDGDAQIHQVVVRLSPGVFSNYEYSGRYESRLTPDQIAMIAASADTHVTVRRDDLILCCHLADFPHGPRVGHKEGENGEIELHMVPAGVEVLALRTDGVLTWCPVTYWSRHPKRKIEIVTLQSGRQIVTDDHPRAVFGVSPASLDNEASPVAPFPTWARATPTEALAGRMMVPVRKTLSALGDASPGTQEDADEGYLLGILAGHGHVRPDCVSLNGAHVTIMNWVKAAVQRRFPQGRHVRFPRSSLRGVVLKNIDLATWAAAQTGLGDARGRFLPPGFLTRPIAYREALLAGILDTKGSINQRRRVNAGMQASVTSVDLRLIQDIQLLARSLELPSRITPMKTPPAWKLNFNTPELARSPVVQRIRHPVRKKSLTKAAPPVTDNLKRVETDLVPLPARFARFAATLLVGRKAWAGVYPPALKAGYISRIFARKLIAEVGEPLTEHPDYPAWKAIIDDAGLTWDPVVLVQRTGRRETGYDLTVPGAETFMAVDGTILSNTMTLHVPASDGAVQDIRDKLMASKMLFSVKDPSKVVPVIKQEQILGLYHSHKKLPQATHRFATAAQAKKAILAGQVPFSDEVEITEPAPPAGPDTTAAPAALT